MKKKYIIIIASIILVVAFGLVIFKIVGNKRTNVVINDEDTNATMLLMISTMEPDNSKSFIFLESPKNSKDDNIVFIKGYTGIDGKLNTSSSEKISSKEYKNITKQVKSATRCDEPTYDCYLVTFNGKTPYFIKQNDIDLKY